MSRVGKATTVVGFVAVILGLSGFVYTYLPTARETVERDGAYLLLLGHVLWFAGLAFLLTEHRLKYRICAVLTAISTPLIFLAYVVISRWR